ncbi:MAG: hypothetical protein JWP04_1071 [Belnapia sp.]|nr:hypothetical protein [Belnapia sp.]
MSAPRDLRGREFPDAHAKRPGHHHGYASAPLLSVRFQRNLAASSKPQGEPGRPDHPPAGSQTRKQAPLPGSLSISSSPRWRLTICLTMASPSPVPPALRDRPRSTR